MKNWLNKDWIFELALYRDHWSGFNFPSDYNYIIYDDGGNKVVVLHNNNNKA